MNTQDKQTVQLAMGRIFGMMQRPSQDGDVAEYERCRSLILNLVEGTPAGRHEDTSHCWVRDRNKGAQGD